MPRKLGKDLKPLPGFGCNPEHARWLKDQREVAREVKKLIRAKQDARKGKIGGIYTPTEDEKRKARDEKLRRMIEDTTPQRDTSVYEIKGT